jgi:hypothetical protein
LDPSEKIYEILSIQGDYKQITEDLWIKGDYGIKESYIPLNGYVCFSR